jgi:hypothetical protein
VGEREHVVLDQQLSSNQSRGSARRRCAIEPGDRRRAAQLGIGTQQRDRTRDLRRARRKLRELPRDPAPHQVGGECADAYGRVDAGVEQLAGELAKQERITAGQLPAGIA